jgi:hypothetical protein
VWDQVDLIKVRLDALLLEKLCFVSSFDGVVERERNAGRVYPVTRKLQSFKAHSKQQ